jgi:flagellar hook assembly protein FlgD
MRQSLAILALTFLLVLLSICLLFSKQILQPQIDYSDGFRNTEGSLAFTVRTVSYNGSYHPRNVGAIWITNSSNQFIKTIKVWGQEYRYVLVKWVASSGNNTTGAITGASLNNHQLHSVTWNGKNTSNVTVPDGDYKVNVEFSEHNASTNNPGKYKFVTFTKGDALVDITPPNETYFSDMHLVWTPTAPANGTISGTVKNSSNQPIGGAIITIGSITATSAPNGSFSFTLQPGTYSLTCSAVNYLPQTLNNVAVTSSQTTTANFILEPVPAGTLSGIVNNASNQPITGAVITSGSQTAASAQDGSYSLSLQPGTYTVTCSANNYQTQTLSDIVISSNQTMTADFILEPIPNGTISGTVTDSSNQPISGAVITDGNLTATTSETGFYSISVFPGSYNLSCSASDYISQTQNNILVASNQITTVDFNLAAVANGDVVSFHERIILRQNYPNPFMQNTKIVFYLDKSSVPRLVIYNSKGQLVRTLLSSGKAKGWHEINWDGKMNNGNNLPSGNYFIRLEADGIIESKTAVILK